MIAVSIVVPVYNVEPYVEQCLESIRCQTLKNIEVILVDDGSKDRSGKICDDFCEKDNRFKVIHIENAGASAARNAGLRVCRGQYIGFVDSDDAVAPDMFSRMFNLCKENDADIAECDVYQGWKGEEIKQEIVHQKITIQSEDILKRYFIGNKTGVWCRLYKKELMTDFRFEEGALAEDVIACYRLFEKAKKVVYIDAKYYYYRVVESSLSRKKGHVTDFQSERVANIVKKEHPEVYYYAKMHTYQSALNLFNANIRNPFDDNEDILKFDTIKKKYIKEYRNNIVDIIKSPVFSKGAKIQMVIISISYDLYKTARRLYNRK